eukprot:scaffold655864_cov38-Prasinocladus_malaysianus.AAC.1
MCMQLTPRGVHSPLRRRLGAFNSRCKRIASSSSFTPPKDLMDFSDISRTGFIDGASHSLAVGEWWVPSSSEEWLGVGEADRRLTFMGSCELTVDTSLLLTKASISASSWTQLMLAEVGEAL